MTFNPSITALLLIIRPLHHPTLIIDLKLNTGSLTAPFTVLNTLEVTGLVT